MESVAGSSKRGYAPEIAFDKEKMPAADPEDGNEEASS